MIQNADSTSVLCLLGFFFVSAIFGFVRGRKVGRVGKKLEWPFYACPVAGTIVAGFGLTAFLLPFDKEDYMEAALYFSGFIAATMAIPYTCSAIGGFYIGMRDRRR